MQELTMLKVDDWDALVRNKGSVFKWKRPSRRICQKITWYEE